MKMMKDRFCGEHARCSGRTSAVVMFLILAVIIMSIGSQSVFADDTTSGGSTVAASIKCGEHGTVNEKTGEFTETVASGGNLHLEFAADEGYVIGSILINEEQLDDEDMEGIAGAISGVLDFEGLEDSLSVQVVFMTVEEYSNKPTTGGDDNDPGNEGGTVEGGTDDTGSEGGNTGGQEQADPDNNGGDDQSDPDSSDEVTDPQNPDDGNAVDDPAVEDPSASDDESGDGSYDQEDTSGDTDSNYDDEDSDSEYSDEDGTSDDDQLSEQENSDYSVENQSEAEDETADETTTGSDTVSDSNDTKTSSAVSEESDNDDDEDDTSNGKGDYYDTPKTGDDRHVLPLLLTIIGSALTGIAAILARRRAAE